jgi:hypothetical protein
MCEQEMELIFTIAAGSRQDPWAAGTVTEVVTGAGEI